MNNKVVKTWTHSRSGGYSAYLLSDGSVLRPANPSSTASLSGGGSAGSVQRYSWSGSLVWDYQVNSSSYISHHDIEPMPNGNVLILVWEVKSASACVAAGLNRSAALYVDYIIEVKPSGSTGGTIVWQWHAWDHLIQDYNSAKSNYGTVSDHPELFDINMGSSGSTAGGDWLHLNSVKYDSTKDQIVVSSHFMNEIYIIDHSTTTAQAATHTGGNCNRGGDILYRWGCPSNYDISGTTYFSVVHCATWVPQGYPGAGHVMAFNNGYSTESSGSSSIIELALPANDSGSYDRTSGTAFGPTSPTWSYTLSSSLYAYHLGGCQRLPNGNTLIVSSIVGTIFEIDSNGTTQWTFSPGVEVARALRYSSSYSGLDSLTDTDTQVIAASSSQPSTFTLSQNYPNPFNPSTTISYTLSQRANVRLDIFDLQGRLVTTLVNGVKDANTYTAAWAGTNSSGRVVASGVYFYRLQVGTAVETKKLVLLK